jgi:hypothetical protein
MLRSIEVISDAPWQKTHKNITYELIFLQNWFT